MTGPWILLYGFLAANLAAGLLYFFFKRNQKNLYKLEQHIRSTITSIAFSEETPDRKTVGLLRRHRWLSLQQTAALHGTLILSQEERNRISALFERAGIIRELQKALESSKVSRRYAAALYLRFLLPADNRLCLAERLPKENRFHVRIALVKGLLDSSQAECFNAIAESLSFGQEYARSIAAMLKVSGHHFIGWARKNLQTGEKNYKRAILYGASIHTSSWLQDFARHCLSDPDPQVREAAAECAATYPQILTAKTAHTDPKIRDLAIRAEARGAQPLDFSRYLQYFEDQETFAPAVEGLRDYLARFPDEIDTLITCAGTEESPERRRGAALSLAGRLPFLLANRTAVEKLAPVISEAVAAGYSSAIISFLNGTRDTGVLRELLPLLKPLVERNPEFRESCIRFLAPALCTELGIEGEQKELNSPRIPLGRRDRALLGGTVFLIIALPVVLILTGYSHSAAYFSLPLFLQEIVITFTRVFAWYTAALNTIYLMLLIFAVANLFRQTRYWRIQDQDFLFTPGVVPSVAIIAPAYNEEKTVIESVNSLLTLIYPDYEVIVINDGSKDRTMEVLNEKFQLKRIDSAPSGQINTALVRGVYRSPLNMRLLVIDKENGGKADALNCGINHAGKEYICSIDSDSLLEPDSLLRMTSEAMTGKEETIAIGGNILPVNGCTVEHGALQRIALGKNRFVRLQTIEYLRSFIAGRLGWAQLKSLLIISGAFGIFRRRRVLEIGGYLTGRGRHRRDTVGEDMELVVRLIRHMGDKRHPYRVSYAATANCWTEVPENLGGIYKQRDRWHRGLAEILTYHRRMIFNPRYGAAGLIALPYFLLFELIGPFYELAGYAVLITGFAVGLLSFDVFLVMFTIIILYGMLISLIALLLAEFGIVYFKGWEVVRLLLSVITESFGFRQLMGWIRVFSLIGMLFKNKDWQKLERRGFGSGTLEVQKK